MMAPHGQVIPSRFDPLGDDLGPASVKELAHAYINVVDQMLEGKAPDPRLVNWGDPRFHHVLKERMARRFREQQERIAYLEPEAAKWAALKELVGVLRA